MLATIPFFSALVLLTSFLVFRAWEIQKKKRLFNAYRTKLDENVSRLYRKLVMGEVPASWRMAIIMFFHRAAHRAIIFSVEILRTIERRLSRLSHYMRTRPPSTEAREVSSYLKKMVPEKKNGEGNGTTPPAGV